MIKQIIIVRKDLNCRRGKEIAQGAHASISFFAAKFFKNGEIDSNCQQPLNKVEKEWLDTGMAKICLQVQTEQELIDIINEASKAGISNYSIVDSGKTEFGGVPTLTCVALGPDESSKIDLITGNLKLY